MPTYEGLRLKILKYWRVGLANQRKKQLKSTDFTVISNNCWGGMIYESYNLPNENGGTRSFTSSPSMIL